jgi:Flp pilus assembly protein TadG
MPVPFGFSAGDIVLAIQLLLKVSAALKETGGASSEYQEILHFLNTAKLVLEHLGTTDLSKLDLPAKNAIRAQATAAIKPLQQFLTEVEEYATSLGNVDAKTSSRAAFQKAKWTLVVMKKLEVLRNRFTADLQVLQLLLQTEIM